jgi:hypothetical protein
LTECASLFPEQETQPLHQERGSADPPNDALSVPHLEVRLSQLRKAAEGSAIQVFRFAPGAPSYFNNRKIREDLRMPFL